MQIVSGTWQSKGQKMARIRFFDPRRVVSRVHHRRVQPVINKARPFRTAIKIEAILKACIKIMPNTGFSADY